jgi:hypothetical protein
VPFALAVTMLTAVALSLTVLGTLGAALAGWQLLGWAFAGGVPLVADAWRGAGLAGELLVAFFRWLPVLLGAAIVVQTLIAWLGVGLLWRQPWARRAALAFACAWAVLAALALGVAHYVLADLGRGYVQYAHFAAVVESLAVEVTLVNLALAVALALLLIQPAVRVQFSAGR